MACCFHGTENWFIGCLKRIWYFLASTLLGYKWTLIEIFSTHKKFEVNDLVHRPGQIAVITGGARGIGLEVIKTLLICEYHVIMGCRSVETGQDAIDAIRKLGITTGNAECLRLDLMSFESIRDFANQVLNKKQKIHLLINNAGIMAVPHQLTKDGYESQLQVNHFGHFLLTNLLLPTIIKTSKEENVVPRIVFVNSIAQFGGNVYFDDFSKSKFYCPYKTYMDAKLFSLVSANHLDRQLKTDGNKVNVYSLHPGIIPTSLWDSAPRFVRFVMTLIAPIFRNVSEGGQDVSYAALSPEIENESGIFLINNKKHKTSTKADDKTLQEKLWDVSNVVVGLKT